jgi:hypothetical protein
MGDARRERRKAENRARRAVSNANLRENWYHGNIITDSYKDSRSMANVVKDLDPLWKIEERRVFGPIDCAGQQLQAHDSSWYVITQFALGRWRLA